MGTLVLNLTATDPDTIYGPTVTYSLSGNDVSKFSLGNSNGSITVRTVMDYESSVKSYSISVTASDADPVSPRSSTVSVSIAVLDCNDNSPVFSSPFYTASLVENLSPGTAVVTVLATDADQPLTPTSAISYSLSLQTSRSTAKLASLVWPVSWIAR
eukprot:m.471913 g.471913  ORF g.471913 m.471913 type:complete len:157 (+) comp57107_c1_seq13:807-1277(+)